ncbi:hypothetical protein GGH94_001391 [Coemansia aciculifera]|uniref:Asparagine synthetase domain-containing protein n=1 Tax=Coemansia aciculifera TaxID=417176 RepID=A0A9W8IMX9_9FUNG|nr:hypothetical protein GGH94_001391 [Coemansia aciculifera]
MPSMDTEVAYVRQLFSEVLSSSEALACDAVLLSGGLDTSIASETLKQLAGSQLRKAITVTIDPAQNELAKSHGLFIQEPQDVVYARKIAERLGLDHHVLTPTLDELFFTASGESTLELCVRVRQTFDGMELRNAVVIAHALKYAKSIGCQRVCTGDGADELFAGYSFMQGMSDGDLQKYTLNMIKTMSFCAVPLAKALGLEVWSPFLDPRVIEYATTRGNSRELKVGLFEGAQHGKLVLRMAFPEVVSAGRKKEPIECGCGTTVMPALAELAVSDREFENEAKEALDKYGIVVRDKERLVYFRTFSRVVLLGKDPGQLQAGSSDACPDCKFRLRDGTSFCSVCGLYPARPIVRD